MKNIRYHIIERHYNNGKVINIAEVNHGDDKWTPINKNVIEYDEYSLEDAHNDIRNDVAQMVKEEKIVYELKLKI